MTGTGGFTDFEETPVCSEECAFSAYSKSLPRVDHEGGVFLANENNVSVGVYGDRGNEGFGISIANMHVDSAKLSTGSEMGEQARGIYERIKTDLDRQGIPYEEIFQAVI